eukprot:TRINITY_DN9598_c0_g2_i1.p1 TRINITY_DN9598_c0_g2~~TRINITY_DN9598_c0_g2_i1.p1  ORF type:complete len:889 (-),score=84.29 TRINITY_DN9598_c0_g2_i1:25-2691(-)
MVRLGLQSLLLLPSCLVAFDVPVIDDECRVGEDGRWSSCSLRALQLLATKAEGTPGCDNECLRSCVPGEDPSFLASNGGSMPTCASACPSCDTSFQTALDSDHVGQGLKGPDTSKEWGLWLSKLVGWKIKLDTELRALNSSFYSSMTNRSLYSSARVNRSSATYVSVQTMIQDRNLYDPILRQWTPTKYLRDLKMRFGGVDQVLLWAGYPNLGIDTRNQFDILDSVPGGIKSAVQALKSADPELIVQLPYKPWDISTQGLGLKDPEALAQMVVESGADGFNADTMLSTIDSKGNLAPMNIFFDAAERQGMHDMLIEPELGLSYGYLLSNVTTQSWQYSLQTCSSCSTNYDFKPLVSTQKILVRKSMPHVCGRWASQRSNEILTAYFNAVGYVAWENIWGIWNGINDRDAELLRRASSILRHFHDFLSDDAVEWLPHYPIDSTSSVGKGIFASKFVGADKELWLLINTALEDASTADWSVAVPHGAMQNSEFYDIYHGVQVEAHVSNRCLVKSCSPNAATLLVSVPLESRSVGALLRIRQGEQLSALDNTFLERMKELTANKLARYSDKWGPVAAQNLVLAAGRLGTARPNTGNMVMVSGSHSFEFRARGSEIEGFLNDQGVMDVWEGVDVQYPWESVPTKYHKPHFLAIADLWFDKHPVTNSDFWKFMQSTSYVPDDTGNFLRHWGKACERPAHEDCRMPAQMAQQPVVFVSIEDARAYCTHSGKRLPREWEWQYAAQGGDPSRQYPWGSDWLPKLMPPVQDDARTSRMIDVGEFPQGASKHGIEDFVGLIWHWTDEYSDAHTRSAVLKGGSAFQPQNSHNPRYQQWYFPGLDGDWTKGNPWEPPYTNSPKNYSNLYKLTVHAKYLIMAPSYDRAGTVGFRCVADTET